MVDANKASGSREVKPLQLVGAGALALSLGALLGFSSHYFGTAKELTEEGINPKTRLRVLPVAAKALAASSLMCGVLGLIAVGGWKLAGLQYKEIAEVSSWQDALNLAQQQRDVVQQQFHQQLFNKQQQEAAAEEEETAAAAARSN